MPDGVVVTGLAVTWMGIGYAVRVLHVALQVRDKTPQPRTRGGYPGSKPARIPSRPRGPGASWNFEPEPLRTPAAWRGDDPR